MVRRLPVEVMQRISRLMRIASGRRLAMVRVRASAHRVERIALSYSDGSARVCGGVEGEWCVPFTLAPSESLRAVEWTHDGRQMRTIQMYTSLGRISPRYGTRRVVGGLSRHRCESPGTEILSLRLFRCCRLNARGQWRGAGLDGEVDVDLAPRPIAADLADLEMIFAPKYAAIHACPPVEPSVAIGPVAADDVDGSDSGSSGVEVSEPWSAEWDAADGAVTDDDDALVWSGVLPLDAAALDEGDGDGMEYG